MGAETSRDRSGTGRWTVEATILTLSLVAVLTGPPAWGETAPEDPEDACLESLLGVHQNTASPSQDSVARFLRAVHADACGNNVDLKEWSTETIYDLMLEAPETFFSVLMEAPRPVETSVIHALEGPVDLLIDYPGIYEAIKTRLRDQRLRDYALRLFKPHYRRYLREQKEWEESDLVREEPGRG